MERQRWYYDYGAKIMEYGYYHPSRGYWQALAKPCEEELATYPEGAIEVSVKPGSDYES
jgi:hypothetical protein